MDKIPKKPETIERKLKRAQDALASREEMIEKKIKDIKVMELRFAALDEKACDLESSRIRQKIYYEKKMDKLNYALKHKDNEIATLNTKLEEAAQEISFLKSNPVQVASNRSSVWKEFAEEFDPKATRSHCKKCGTCITHSGIANRAKAGLEKHECFPRTI